MISINKDEALYLAKLFPPKKVRDMYTGDLHIERMVRRTMTATMNPIRGTSAM